MFESNHDAVGSRRAALLGLGVASDDGVRRCLTAEHAVIVGGSAEDHAAMVETLLRLETELERMGRHLGQLPPDELIELAWRIDSPELMEAARRLRFALKRRGLRFEDLAADHLTELAGESFDPHLDDFADEQDSEDEINPAAASRFSPHNDNDPLFAR